MKHLITTSHNLKGKYPRTYRPLPISPKDIFVAVLANTGEHTVLKQDFEIIKLIGKGGFSSVYEGICCVKCSS